MDNSTDEGISEVKVEKEIQEITVENPYTIEDDEKDAKRSSVSASSEKIKLVYKSPRMFRKSLIYKTWKLFGTKKPKSEPEEKYFRPLKEKYEA